jgi:hypothetical protein
MRMHFWQTAIAQELDKRAPALLSPNRWAMQGISC